MKKIKIVPKPGDVLKEGIVVDLNGRSFVMRQGLITINRSRLRCALRLGWHVYDKPLPNIDMPARLVAVRKP